MKVDATKAAQNVQPPKQPFAQVMKQTKPATPAAPKTATPVTPAKTATPNVPTKVATNARATDARPGVAVHARPLSLQTAASPTKQLSQARVHVDAEAKRLGTVRSDHSQAAHSMTQTRTERGEQLDEKQTAKLIDALTQEFSKEPQHQQPVMPVQKIELGTAQAKVDAPPETKAAQATALIEKIEHFVRSNRPGLSLTLNNSLGARVELERIGPKELSVKLFGKPGAEAVGRIREELRARGLTVKLTVV